MRKTLSAGLLSLFVVGASGCTWLAGFVLPGVEGCEGPLRPVAELGPDRMLRERVRVRAPEVDARYELVVVKRDGELTVVAFTGLGAQAFRAVQRGEELTVDDRMGPASPVPPRTLVSELHRVRFDDPGAPVTIGESFEVASPGCAFRSTWVRIEDRPLPGAQAPSRESAAP